MKKLITIFSFLIIIPLVFISINSISSKEGNKSNLTTSGTSDPEEFLIGAYNIGCAMANSNDNPMQELGLNMWHRFLEQETLTVAGLKQRRFPKGFTTSDGLFANVSSYQSEAVNFYNNASQLNNNFLYLTRPKIEMQSFAQRSDYCPIN